MKFFFETYGCQMNLAESAALALAARERGWEEAGSAAEADLVLINTCSVRETAERRVRGRLAHYAALRRKQDRPFALILAGCMAQRLEAKIRKDFPVVDFVMGTSARSRFPLILEAVERGLSGAVNGAAFRAAGFIETGEKPVFSFSSVHFDTAGNSPFRSFVPIMHGCNNFCSYCIVPHVRGREVSRSPGAVLEEIRLVGEKGVREICLLGQNVNSYFWIGDFGLPNWAAPSGGNSQAELDFPGLLELIARNLGSTGIGWIRFLSSHPRDLSRRAIEVMAAFPAFCCHIHLCVQHGSNRVLAAMNRRYTREQYLELVASLRSAMPGISLTTDILVGFPGETGEDLEQTLSLMEEVKFLYAYMYHYNPREGTAAFDLPDMVSDEVKRERLSRVIALQKRHTSELLKSRVGQEAVVLIEGISRKNADELISRTERDEMVVVPGRAGQLGSFARLTLASLRGNTFRAGIMEIL